MKESSIRTATSPWLVGIASLLIAQGGAAQTAPAGTMKDYSSPVIRKLDQALLRLDPGVNGAMPVQARRSAEKAAARFFGMQNGTVLVEGIAEGNAAELARALERLGLTDMHQHGRLVSGRLPVTALATAAEHPALRFLRPVYQPVANIGAVTSQGDAAQRSDTARANFSVDGSGVTVGVISVSYDNQSGAAAGVLAGELPGAGNPNGFTTPVNVLAETPPAVADSDEGRAMMEIIHDVAPGASLAFHSGFLGTPAFAEGIGELAQAGADIIVDDVAVLTDPFFQDGVIAQAIDAVTAQGVAYISSAGNFGRESYESEFRSAGVFTIPGHGDYELHDFDPGPGVDVFLRLNIPSNGTFTLGLVLQWDDPFASTCVGCPGADTDLDLFVSITDGLLQGILWESVDNNIGGDALEVIQQIGTVAPGSGYAVVGRAVAAPGPNPNPGRIKMVSIFGGSFDDPFETNSPTIVGHLNAATAIATGATDYRTVPAQKGAAPQIQSFSSAGGTPILFDTNGAPISPVVRQKPDIVAPDNVNTSFFVAGVDPDNDGIPNFDGTSAAAPHVGGIAALMLEASGGLSPAALRTVLAGTAIDMDDPFTPAFDNGYDPGTGFGFVQADDAVQAVSPP